MVALVPWIPKTKYETGESYPEVFQGLLPWDFQKRVILTRKLSRTICLWVLGKPCSGEPYPEVDHREPKRDPQNCRQGTGTPAPEWAPAGFPAHKTLNQPTGDVGCLVSFQGFGVWGWGWVDQTATRWSPAQIPEQGLNLNRS